jgi:hypothetical protein
MTKWYSLLRGFICVTCIVTSVTYVGCGDGSYTVDPVTASNAAVEMYDKNGDGLLDQTELRSCPALARELRAYDESKDSKLSAEEIAAQIRSMFGQNAGMTPLTCTINLDGSPLSGATVKFIPESFLGPEIKEATGVTNSAGSADLAISPDELPKELRRHNLMRVGIYRVEVTHPTKKIPARYNTETELGFEFHQINHVTPPTYNLVSK